MLKKLCAKTTQTKKEEASAKSLKPYGAHSNLGGRMLNAPKD